MASRFMCHHMKQWTELGRNLEWKDYLLSLELDATRVQNIISGLSDCTCCERHQVNRPNTLCQPATAEDIVGSTVAINAMNCTCRCRHDIRHLCRIFDPHE